MPKKPLTIIFLTLVVILLSTAGFRCKFTPAAVQQAAQPIELLYWRASDSSSSFTDIVNDYNVAHTNIKITYKQFRPEEYEEALLNAWSENKGPDIFSISNNLLGKYKSKILPLPDKLTVPYTEITGTIKKEKITVLKTSAAMTLKGLKDNFVDTVYNDVVFSTTDPKTKVTKTQIYGLPLSVDSLALFYNKDLLNSARIAQPPATWTEFQDDVKKLTLLDRQGNIIQSGAAIGTADNVLGSADLLSILMMQNGSAMAANGRAQFNQPSPRDIAYYPAHDALTFYADFANPGREVYTWNDEMPNSLDAFIRGQTAFFFGYSHNIPTIKAQAPKLNFGIGSLPQIEGVLTEMTYANYNVETVFKNTQHPNEAWDFVQYAASQSEAPKYLTKASKPTALRNLIGTQLEDFDLGVFAQQALIARSWYHGADYHAVESIFKGMVNDANQGLLEIRRIVDDGVNKVNQTMP